MLANELSYILQVNIIATFCSIILAHGLNLNVNFKNFISIYCSLTKMLLLIVAPMMDETRC